MSKRICCVILTLCLLMGMAPPIRAAVVASGTYGKNLTWSLDDAGTLTISGSGWMPSTTSIIDIPWYNYYSEITIAVIQDGITSIGGHAFYNGRSLISVTIPNSVTYIGSYAFYTCKGLTSVTIPNNVTSIDEGAFSGCSGLTSVTIPASVTDIATDAFYECNALTSVYYGGTKAQWNAIQIDYNFSMSNFNPNDIHISNTVLKKAAIYCTDGVLNGSTGDDTPATITVTFDANGGAAVTPQSVSVGADGRLSSLPTTTRTGYTFDGWYLNNGIRVGTNTVFTKSATITAKWTDNGSGSSSSGGSSGSSGGSGSGSSSSGGGGSSGSGQQNPVINTTPDNETYLVEFDENGGSGVMNAVTVRGNTYTLPENGFLPPYGMRFRAWRVEYERGDTFEYFPNTTIPISSDATVTALWEKDTAALALGYCGAEADGRNLTWSLSRDWNLTISGTGDMASYDADNRAPWYGYHTNIQTATLESGVTKLGSNAFTYCAALETVTLPDTLVTIEEGAFLNCAALESVNLPSGLLVLENRAFYGCESLRSVTIPANVADTGDYTFENCTSLSSVSLPAGLTRIGYYAFYNCTSLKKIAIPQNVSVLNTGTFSGCASLREVAFPEALTRISDGVFENCRALRNESRNVSYPGTVEQFGAIALTLGGNNDPLKAQVVHCVNGDYDWTPPDPYRVLDKLPIMYGFSDQIWRLAGPFFEFRELHIGDADGYEILEQKNVLTRTGLDYLAEEGSTKLTIPAETFQHFGYGSHTIAADFFNPTDGLTSRDEIYTIFPPDKAARIDSSELYGVNGVEKVSYSGRFRSAPVLMDGLYRFRVIDGQIPPGLTLRDGGYFTGAAQTAGTYIFTVGLQLKRGGAWPSDYEDTEQVIVVIEPGTEENIVEAADPGYEIIVRVPDQEIVTEMDPEKFELVSQGPYEEFEDLYVDGLLIPKENYEVRPVNLDSLPTVLDQGAQTGTFIASNKIKLDTGLHPINLHFVHEDKLGNKEVRKATQNVKITKKASAPAPTYAPSGGTSGSSSAFYSITIAESANGAVTLSRKDASYGQKVTITATPKAGYRVGAVKVTASNGKAVSVSGSGEKYTFTMPSRRVTVSASFTGSSGTPTTTPSTTPPTTRTGTATLQASPNGTARLSATSAAVGDTITLFAMPEKGYLVLGVEARDANGLALAVRPIGNDSYIFSMPAGGVTAKANFTPKRLGTFQDILGPYWFFDDAEWAYNRGILRGVTDEYWEPETKVSDVTSIVTLERLDNADLTPYDNGALDGLDNSKWYVSAARWARNNGICDYNRTFSEYEPLKRGEYAVMLYNFLRYRGLNVTTDNPVNYTDAAALTPEQREAFQALQYAGVFKGYEDGAIHPEKNLNRAQLASLLHRLSQYIIRAETFL